jgi:hypothetical protein
MTYPNPLRLYDALPAAQKPYKIGHKAKVALTQRTERKRKVCKQID